MKSVTQILLLFAICGLLLSSCEKGNDTNPFDDQNVNQDTVKLEIIDPEPASIAGIYQNVFKPTCANSGCHDGTFDPDFRTMESSYNTLLFQEPIKNDGNYLYRVEPGNVQRSALMARLENRLTPVMPIQVDPDSDWPEKGDEYIEHIRQWIEAGAPDITGTVRQKNYPAPVLLGAGARVGQDWQVRLGGTGPLLLNDSIEQARFYFAFKHDEIDPVDFTYNQVAFSPVPDNFHDSIAIKLPLEILQTPLKERGFYGEQVDYTHSVSIQLNTILDLTVDQWYFRVYVQDDKNPVTEIPTDNGIFYIKSYMSFQWSR